MIDPYPMEPRFEAILFRANTASATFVREQALGLLR